MIKVNPNLVAMLNAKGYTRTRLRKENIFGGGQFDHIYYAQPSISLKTIDTLCRLLNVQPQDIITYEKDPE